MKIVYLTVDDGPSKDFKSKVDYLYSKNILAIFFCLGKLMQKRPNEIIYAIKKGFVIGNHSYNHPKFSDISISEAEMQIYRTDKIIDKLYKKSGIKRAIKVFRFPHGDKGNEETKEKFQEILRKLSYKQPKFKKIKWYGRSYLGKEADTYWTYNSKDYTVGRYRELKEKSPYGFSSPDLIFERMDENDPKNGKGLNFLGSNDIILMHDSERTSGLFFCIINKLIEKNIKIKLPIFK